ncbi:MAG: hypothetical protein IPI49_14580 [Myxococcales bacterium]|nr:hypothetical protein [Myxococcales bacterium]
MLRLLPWIALLALAGAGCHKKPDQDHGKATPAAGSVGTGAGAQGGPGAAGAAPPAAPLDLEDPKACAACHAAIVAEFTDSMHAQAHHELDPIYRAMRTLRIAKEGEQIPQACARCHTPRAVSAPDSELARAGVSCATCHNLAKVELSAEARGVEALRFAEPTMLRGPHDVAPGKAVVHGTGPAQPALADGTTVCLACHGEERNPQGLATCATGVEHAGDERSCTSCHMPEVPAPNGVAGTRPTHRSHAFLGPHRAWQHGDLSLFAEHLSVSGRFEGKRFIAVLHNRAAHSFPTGFPARLAMLAMTGFDAKGQQVWSNFAKDPLADHPDAVFGKGYVDAEGKPTLAPYAAKMARDHRLERNEQRELGVEVPPTVARVELALKLWLVAPLAAQKLSLTGPLTEPRVILKATATR